jgi:hypothetical protein
MASRNQDLDDERSNTSLSEDTGGLDSGMSVNRKRTSQASDSLPDDGDDKDDKKNRGNYRCGRCNLPKKGHVCPFQPVLKPRDRAQANSVDVEVQAELDADMTLACLGPLHLQGLPESYMEVYPKIRRISTVPT